MGFLGDILGSKADVPKFRRLNADQIQAATVKGNAAIADDALQLTKKIGDSTQETALEQLRKVFPNFDRVSQLVGSNIESGLRGQLPESVTNQITDAANARAFSQGLGGSPFSGAGQARDLGLTSLSRIDRSIGDAQDFIRTSQGLTSVADPSSMFLTPATRLGFEQGERNAEFIRDTQAAAADASPDPILSAFFNPELAFKNIGAIFGGSGINRDRTVTNTGDGGGGGNGGAFKAIASFFGGG